MTKDEREHYGRIANGGCIACIVLGIGYTLKGNPQQFWPIVKFRIDTLKGLIGL